MCRIDEPSWRLRRRRLESLPRILVFALALVVFVLAAGLAGLKVMR